eukprot:4985150-Prymnesium_polylepis.2
MWLCFALLHLVGSCECPVCRHSDGHSLDTNHRPITPCWTYGSLPHSHELRLGSKYLRGNAATSHEGAVVTTRPQVAHSGRPYQTSISSSRRSLRAAAHELEGFRESCAATHRLTFAFPSPPNFGCATGKGRGADEPIRDTMRVCAGGPERAHLTRRRPQVHLRAEADSEEQKAHFYAGPEHPAEL